jgi:hypothetical protein
MRGFVLSLDAIFAISILLTLTVFLSGLSFTYSTPELQYERLYYKAKDIVNIMREVKISNIRDIPVVEDYVNNNIIEEEDFNKTLLEMIGTFWAEGNTTYARDLFEGVFENITNTSDYGYEILIDNESIYKSDNNEYNYLSRLETIISGYSRGKPTSGYVARAVALEIKKNDTLIVMGDVISSSVRTPWGGNNKNKVNVTYYINIPEDATINEASAFIQTVWTDNNFKLYINGEFVYQSSGSARLEDIKDYLHPGNNTANVVSRFGWGGDEGGDDGSTHFIVSYNTTQFQTYRPQRRFHFQRVESQCSIRYKKPIFIVNDVNSIKVRLNLTPSTQVQTVTLYFRWKGQQYTIGSKAPTDGVVEWTDSEIRSVIEGNGIDYSDLKDRFFWFIVDIDTYHSREYRSYWRIIDDRDSYVEVDYEYEVPYSYIDLTKSTNVEDYWDKLVEDFYQNVIWNFSVPSGSIPLEARWQLAWIWYVWTDPEQKATANDIVLYHHDPYNSSSDPFIEEFARFGYSPNEPGAMVIGDNDFELNFGYKYGVSPFKSIGSYKVLVKSMVGYGQVFENETAAIEDAENRLKEFLGEFIEATDIEIDSQSVANVPSMWGPAKLEIRVWR